LENGGYGVLLGWEMLEEKPRQERLKYQEKLKDALHIIHDQGFVHSDVRAPNILVFEDNVNLIDFDHCGKEGVGRYLREWDHRQCPEGAKEGECLRKSHDNGMLERIFERSPPSRRRELYST
jgi:serine/threonine protein kinase